MTKDINIATHEEGGGAKNQRFSFTWIGISLGIGLLIWLLPTPEGLDPRAHRFLAFLVTIVILWTSEAIPIGVTSIMVGCGLIILNIQSSQAAWAPYANRTVVFVFFIIMLGVLLGQTSITNRLMGYILKIGGTNVRRLSFILCMGATFLAAWTHDTTITIILLYAMMPMFLGVATWLPTHPGGLRFRLFHPVGSVQGAGVQIHYRYHYSFPLHGPVVPSGRHAGQH
ncbi:MAG: SLC13 family permease [Desulfotignum sp.]